MKNLHLLNIYMMLNVTGQWLGDDAFREALEISELGVAMLSQLNNAHEPLAELKNKRAEANAKLRSLIDAGGGLDLVHDSKARSLYYHLHALSEGAQDQAKATEYRDIQAVLFPDGLTVIKLPFIQEGGAAFALERAVSPELRAKLASISVGEQTLDDLFGAWIAAGLALGKVVDQRANLKASLGRKGSSVGEIDIRGGRSRWVKAVNGLLWAIDMDPKLGPVAERVHATLDEAIAARLRARDSDDDVGAIEDADADEDTSDDDDLALDDEAGDDVEEEELAEVAE